MFKVAGAPVVIRCAFMKIYRKCLFPFSIAVGIVFSFLLFLQAYYESTSSELKHLSQPFKLKVLHFPLADQDRKISEYDFDESGQYITHSNVWVSSRWENLAYSQACLATHSTVNGLHWVASLAEFYQGPISVSIFTPGRDINIATVMVRSLRKFHPQVAEWVNFHVFYPRFNQADYKIHLIEILKNIPFSDAEAYNKILLNHQQYTDIRSDQVYPQNIARNLAWKNCDTSHVLNSDVDMIPSYALSPLLKDFLAKTEKCRKCAYIVPIYEIKMESDFPVRNKTTLLALMEEKLVQRYHHTVYKKNQENSHLTLWERTSNSSDHELDVMYTIGKYREYWEPIMLLDKSAPMFFEQFVGYGFTRSSHVYFLNSRNFCFKVLDGAFMSHRGFQNQSNHLQSRKNQNSFNRGFYRQLKENLSSTIHPNENKRSYIQFSDLERLLT